MALARKYRITSDKDFDRAFRFGRVLSGQDATIRFIPNNTGRLRFGVAVSAKKFPLAVLRNRIKRSVFSEISASVEDFKNSYDVVVIAQSDPKSGANDLRKLISRVIGEIKKGLQ